MNETTGWLIDLYPDLAGLSLWLLCDDGRRLYARQGFAVTFHAAGSFARLRQAWAFLRGHDVTLARTSRLDLFSGERDVLSVTVRGPAGLPGLVRALSDQFPDLEYYDTDIPLALRYAAQTGVRLLGRCRVTLDDGVVSVIEALDSPWDLDPAPLPLRVLHLRPDVDPAHRAPGSLIVRHDRAEYSLDLDPPRALLAGLGAVLVRHDPDLILTEYGDTWLFPLLRELDPSFNPNRDPAMEVRVRAESSYFAYGQVVYRGAQTHLFGRWHIDRRNAMLFGEYGLEGVLEQARVTGLGVQDVARKSPGAGITAMQMLTALQRGVLVPAVKQQAEAGKSLAGLVVADRGGLVYQPLTGLHRDVAQIDFSSMYPGIMVKDNISPETTGPGRRRRWAAFYQPPRTRRAQRKSLKTPCVLCGKKSRLRRRSHRPPEGLVPATLRPLLGKRLALKRLLAELDPRDCRAPLLKARAAALKWLLVVCFGYLGYKNARFGRIESHEAVTAASRELMLQAKETAEELGFTVLHMYVDSLFVQQPGLRQPADFAPLLQAIAAQTGLQIALEGVYRWVAFLPSRRDPRAPVANRYFGVFQDGEIKTRGIDLRRGDTCRFVAAIQLKILQILAAAGGDPAAALPAAREFVRGQRRRLRAGQELLEDLLVAQSLRRLPEEYRAPSPSARAARQLQALGKPVRAGMRIRFLFVLGGAGVHAWDAGEPDPCRVDVDHYRRLLERAAAEVLEVFGEEGETRLPGFENFPAA
jgi:DNA polymerase-2